jgi:hypothetical protein
MVLKLAQMPISGYEMISGTVACYQAGELASRNALQFTATVI